MKALKISLACFTILVLAACGKGKYESMSKSELRDKMQHCDSIPKKTAVFANGCEQISKELTRRKKHK